MAVVGPSMEEAAQKLRPVLIENVVFCRSCFAFFLAGWVSISFFVLRSGS